MPVVYFVQGEVTKLIKIGYCHTEKNLRRRLEELQRWSPDKLSVLGIVTEYMQVTEHTLHSVFAKFWSHGEWYRPDSQLLDFISKFASKPADCDGEFYTKHRPLKKSHNAKEFEFPSSAALVTYVKEKVAG